MFRKLMVTLVLAFCAVTSFAIPKPSEVKAAFAAGDYAKAESMLNEVMKERPTAAVHYQLGQVYSKQGKHKEALNEFRQAQALDPSLKFASSAAAFTKNLADEQAMVAPPPPVQQPVFANPITVTAPPVQAAPAETSSGSGVLWFLALLVACGGLFGLFVFLKNRKEQQDAENAVIAERKEKTGTLLGIAKELDDALLIAKTATYSDADKEKITYRIGGLQTQVRSMLAELKDGKEVTQGRIASIKNNASFAVDQANNGLPQEKPVEKVAEKIEEKIVRYSDDNYGTRRDRKSRRAESTSSSRTTVSTSTPAATKVVHHHHYDTPASTPAPSTTVVNGGGTDLLTGVLIGGMMNRQPETPRYEAPTPRYEAPTPRYEAPAPSRELDTPSWSRSDDSYSAPSYSSSTLDTSSDNDRNDSYNSSSDSGNMDSSSSDKDSY